MREQVELDPFPPFRDLHRARIGRGAYDAIFVLDHFDDYRSRGVTPPGDNLETSPVAVIAAKVNDAIPLPHEGITAGRRLAIVAAVFSVVVQHEHREATSCRLLRRAYDLAHRACIVLGALAHSGEAAQSVEGDDPGGDLDRVIRRAVY